MAFLRLAAMLLVAQAVVFFSLMAYLKASRRERLEAEYTDVASDKERKLFVDAAVDAYGDRIRPRLALVVFVLPMAIMAVVIYVTNFM